MKNMSNKIKEAAKKYAESDVTPDYDHFINGAEWAVNNLLSLDISNLSADLIKMKELHNKIFLGGMFNETEAEEYEAFVTKYEGLDLTKIF
jgi:hypothetical protein